MDGSKVKKAKSVVKKDTVETINVNFEDEVIFVLDKIEKSKDENIIVSIPTGSDLLISTVSLALLAEAADKQGKRIVVVTDDETGRNLARTVGIAIRGSVSSVKEDAWKEAEGLAQKRREDAEKRRSEAGEEGEGEELVPVAGVSFGKLEVEGHYIS